MAAHALFLVWLEREAVDKTAWCDVGGLFFSCLRATMWREGIMQHLFVVSAIVLSATLSFAAEKQELIAWPSEEDLGKVESEIREAYKLEIGGAKDAVAMRELARQWLSDAEATADDPTPHLALLLLAKKFAIAGGGAVEASNVSLVIAAYYQPKADSTSEPKEQFAKAQELWGKSISASVHTDMVSMRADAVELYARACLSKELPTYDRSVACNRISEAVQGYRSPKAIAPSKYKPAMGVTPNMRRKHPEQAKAIEAKHREQARERIGSIEAQIAHASRLVGTWNVYADDVLIGQWTIANNNGVSSVLSNVKEEPSHGLLILSDAAAKIEWDEKPRGMINISPMLRRSTWSVIRLVDRTGMDFKGRKLQLEKGEGILPEKAVEDEPQHKLKDMMASERPGKAADDDGDKKQRTKNATIAEHKNKIEIVRAMWGNRTKAVDVTDKLQQAIDDTRNLQITVYVLGDPTPNIPKYLAVKYKMNGREREVTVIEGGIFRP